MLEIEIFSDAICPWCFIGKRRLETALTTSDGKDGFDPEVRLRWRPYLLYPNIPAEGVDRDELLRRRYGPRGDRARVPAAILAEAAVENIELRYDLIERTPNTRTAHRLVEWMYAEHGWQAQHALVEALFQAYFCLGQDIGDAELLYELAKPHGLTESAKDSVLMAKGTGHSAGCGTGRATPAKYGAWGCRRTGVCDGRGVFAAGCPERRDHASHHSARENKIFCGLANRPGRKQRPDTLEPKHT